MLQSTVYNSRLWPHLQESANVIRRLLAMSWFSASQMWKRTSRSYLLHVRAQYFSSSNCCIAVYVCGLSINMYKRAQRLAPKARKAHKLFLTLRLFAMSSNSSSRLSHAEQLSPISSRALSDQPVHLRLSIFGYLPSCILR